MDRISCQQLEYEIDCTDYPVNYIFLIGYFGRPNFTYKNIQLQKASDLILSHFHKEYHSLTNDTLRNKNTQLV